MPKYNISEYMLSRNNLYTLIRKKNMNHHLLQILVFILYTIIVLCYIYTSIYLQWIGILSSLYI